MSCGKCETCACAGGKEPGVRTVDGVPVVPVDYLYPNQIDPDGNPNHTLVVDLSVLDTLAEGTRVE